MAERAESPAVDIRSVLFVAGGILLSLITVIGVLTVIFPQLIHSPTASLPQYPPPSVTVDERTQRINLERAQIERLSGMNGAMPITQAMSAIAAKGTSAYDPVQAATP
ncbi:MAG TPA: hypothetical protein VFW28_20400 [Micropepsaceae bacterium]|nr:hypothetical protein [Micropepsaceae bacterium]